MIKDVRSLQKELKKLQEKYVHFPEIETGYVSFVKMNMSWGKIVKDRHFTAYLCLGMIAFDAFLGTQNASDILILQISDPEKAFKSEQFQKAVLDFTDEDTLSLYQVAKEYRKFIAAVVMVLEAEGFHKEMNGTLIVLSKKVAPIAPKRDRYAFVSKLLN